MSVLRGGTSTAQTRSDCPTLETSGRLLTFQTMEALQAKQIRKVPRW